jgi:hypothetical protein
MCRRIECVYALMVICAVGCGGGGSSPPAEIDQEIRSLIGAVGDTASSAERFATCFVDGATLDQAARQRLREYMPRLERAELAADGTTAAAQVAYEVLQTGEQLPPVPWNLRKVGDQWKVESWEPPPQR